jgi:hypothetical protein
MKRFNVRADHRLLTLTNRFAPAFCRDLFLSGMHCAQSKTAREKSRAVGNR